MCIRDSNRRPTILLIHHLLSYHVIRKYHLLGLFPFLFEEISLRLNRNIITVSPSIERSIKQKLGNKANVVCILNGIDDKTFEVDPFEKDYILFLGRLDIYMKGLDILLKAFSKVVHEYPKTKLKIAGKGRPKDIKKLIDLGEKFRIGDNIDFLGWVSKEEKIRLLAHSKFICMPSRFEGWGIVAVEAAAASKPVIGTNIPGLSDAIINRETGILVSPDNSDELAEAMMYLLEHERERKRMGENGRRWAKKFSWDNIAKEQEDIYYKVLEAS